MQELITKYIESKRYAWSETTMRSERYRLQSVATQLERGPNDLWQQIQSMKPYSRLTLWTRVVQFTDWLIEEKLIDGPNEFKKWREKNAKVFKNCYQVEKPDITFEEAIERISRITRLDIRRRALELLGSGLRYSESTKVQGGRVSGKGSRVRDVYRPDVAGEDYQGSYESFRRALSKVNLRPHDLRKIALSRIVELGANEFELCEIAGWSNLNTASSYIKVNRNRLKELAEKLHGGITNVEISTGPHTGISGRQGQFSTDGRLPTG